MSEIRNPKAAYGGPVVASSQFSQNTAKSSSSIKLSFSSEISQSGRQSGSFGSVCQARRLIVPHNDAVFANKISVRVLNFQVIDLAEKGHSSFYNVLDADWAI